MVRLRPWSHETRIADKVKFTIHYGEIKTRAADDAAAERKIYNPLW